MKKIVALILLVIAIMTAIIPAVAGPVAKCCECGGTIRKVYGQWFWHSDIIDEDGHGSRLYLREKNDKCDSCSYSKFLGYDEWEIEF